MNRLARRRDANLLPRGLDSSSQLHQFILSCCMLFTIHCGHRPPHIRREGPTINPVLFERDDPSDLVDVTVARRHSSEREREGAKIRKAKYLTQLFTKWSIFVCNCEAVTCYLFYNGRVARGPDPTKKITHVPETFRAEQSRGAICFASPWITLLPNPYHRYCHPLDHQRRHLSFNQGKINSLFLSLKEQSTPRRNRILSHHPLLLLR